MSWTAVQSALLSASPRSPSPGVRSKAGQLSSTTGLPTRPSGIWSFPSRFGTGQLSSPTIPRPPHSEVLRHDSAMTRLRAHDLGCRAASRNSQSWTAVQSLPSGPSSVSPVVELDSCPAYRRNRSLDQRPRRSMRQGTGQTLAGWNNFGARNFAVRGLLTARAESHSRRT